MPQDFLIGKQSLLKVESNRSYVKENKTQLSVDVDILKNKNYNRFDVSKDPLSVFLNNPPNMNFDYSYPFDPQYPIVTEGLSLYLDASYPSSYAGSGANWYDISGNGNNFTLYNSPTYQTTKLTFNINGANQYAQCNNTSSGNYGSSSFTMEYFFNLATAPNTNNSVSTLFIKRDQSIGIASAGHPGWTFNPGGNGYSGFVSWMDSNGVPNTTTYRIDYNTTLIPENSNLHIVHTVQRNGLQVTGSWYKNSTIQSTIKYNLTGDGMLNSSTAAQIMRSPYLEHYRSGSVYLVRSYNRSLSQSEITQNYNATIGRLGL
jgi:hypothetical protein